ncbi:hypothetical protein ACS0TY_000724 [Phlomoides rotata]
MSCQGCVGAVKRVLGKLEGVESFDIDIEKQKVTVIGNVQPDVVYQTVSKTGKATSFWEAPPAEAPAAAHPPLAEATAAVQAPPAEPESKPTETVAAA